VTAFVVDRGADGLTVGKPMRKLGQRAIVNAEVFLDNVRVPVADRLGEEGQGFYGLMRTFDASRVLIPGLARSLGCHGVTGPADLESTLDKAFAADRPALIHLR
jgi:alkylation response protein AidB-like acyl-CoA dehydrogenase